MSAAVIQHY